MSQSSNRGKVETSITSNCVNSNIVENPGIENMNFMNLDQIIEIIEPIRVKGPQSGAISGISIDTRKPMGDNHVFWAIRGPHFNGADFALDALRSGVRAAVVSRADVFEKQLPPNRTLIQVRDTLEALQRLAAFHRSQFDIPVIGIYRQ